MSSFTFRQRRKKGSRSRRIRSTKKRTPRKPILGGLHEPKSSTETITFNNGCVLVHQQCNASSDYASIRVFCKTGSIHEMETQYGISHLVEHLCFQYIQHNHTDIANISRINGSTYYDYTVYKMDLPASKLSDAITILGKMMFTMEFTEEMIVNEERIIMHELGHGKPSIIEPTLYENTMYAHEIDTLKYHTYPTRFTVDVVTQYYKQHYTPQNIVISIVCNHSLDEILGHVNSSAFYTEPPRTPINSIGPMTLSIPTRVLVTVNEQPGIFVYFRTCPYNHPDTYALSVINSYFSHPFANKLFRSLRTNNTKLYSIRSNMEAYTYVGSFSFKLTLDARNTDIMASWNTENNIFKLFVNALNDVATATIDWEMVKEYMLKTMMSELEISKALASYNGNQYMYGTENSPITYAEYHANHIAPLTPKQIVDVMNRYLVCSRAFVYIPKTLKRYSDVIRRIFQEVPSVNSSDIA